MFDTRDKNFVNKTKSFLRKSIEEIEDLYSKKSKSREEFIKNIFHHIKAMLERKYQKF